MKLASGGCSPMIPAGKYDEFARDVICSIVKKLLVDVKHFFLL
jgi:hypothetical protein